LAENDKDNVEPYYNDNEYNIHSISLSEPLASQDQLSPYKSPKNNSSSNSSGTCSELGSPSKVSIDIENIDEESEEVSYKEALIQASPMVQKINIGRPVTTGIFSKRLKRGPKRKK